MFSPSTKTRYGLEIMTSLAEQYNKKPVSLKTVSEERGLPIKYLEQVASLLKKAKLVKSKEGRSGGYLLTRAPEKVTVNQILEALEGPVQTGDCEGCPSISMCGGQKDVWGEVGDKVRQTVKETTLKDLI